MIVLCEKRKETTTNISPTTIENNKIGIFCMKDRLPPIKLDMPGVKYTVIGKIKIRSTPNPNLNLLA